MTPSHIDVPQAGRGVLNTLLTIGRWAAIVGIAAVVILGAQRVLAQGAAAAPDAAAGTATPAAGGATGGASGVAATAETTTLKDLFLQSFDLFTILLVIGSLAGWTIIIICIIEIRQRNIAPDESQKAIATLIRSGNFAELRRFTSEDDALVSRAVGAALAVPIDDRAAMREAAEMAAGEESARWFRKIEPLNIIGNMGPLLGLAGTVWGMIIAFAALGQAGGQANPATLSIGISKALFHTLLGLMLAVPCLCVFGFYRSIVDRLCTRAMVAAGELVEMLPEDARVRLGGGGGAGPAAPRASQPVPQPAAPGAVRPAPGGGR
jgi:biopolymer transport protein ExbB